MSYEITTRRPISYAEDGPWVCTVQDPKGAEIAKRDLFWTRQGATRWAKRMARRHVQGKRIGIDMRTISKKYSP